MCTHPGLGTTTMCACGRWGFHVHVPTTCTYLGIPHKNPQDQKLLYMYVHVRVCWVSTVVCVSFFGMRGVSIVYNLLWGDILYIYSVPVSLVAALW